MPILTASPITTFDQEAFHAVDRIATGCAFDIHNEMGRYLDERLYQAELAARLEDRGHAVIREMKITLILDGFIRDYYVDILVDRGVIIETKAAESLNASHRAQVLNYVYLCELHHATLLNFRSERVQHEFVSTQLTSALRRQVSWELDEWRPLSTGCETLHNTMQRVLADWGSGLDPTLYRDAVTYFLGGEGSVVRHVEVASTRGVIGTQKVRHLADDIAFSVTASVHRPHVVREHHHRFLRHTSLRAIQWVNLNRQTVSIQTIQK
ncbi:MAG: GxxExxY protein [Pirellulaceae bacterium]|nr:GxxExxY protein [Pirellulaceae bacterium]